MKNTLVLVLPNRRVRRRLFFKQERRGTFKVAAAVHGMSPAKNVVPMHGATVTNLDVSVFVVVLTSLPQEDLETAVVGLSVHLLF